MKTVILNFHTDEQAERFFEAFEGVKSDKGIDMQEITEKSIDNLLLFCDVESISTREEESAYIILAS